MKIDEGAKMRLQFLARVVEKECKHLDQTTRRLFAEPFTVERAGRLEDDEDLSEHVEAFSSRFSRLQDTLGDKLIPQLLGALGERKSTALDNLDVAERLGWLPSVEEWQALRQLRNQMVHDYIEDLDILVSAIKTAESFVPTLMQTATMLRVELQKRSWMS